MHVTLATKRAVVIRLVQEHDWKHLWQTLGSYDPAGPQAERDRAAQQWQAWVAQQK